MHRLFIFVNPTIDPTAHLLCIQFVDLTEDMFAHPRICLIILAAQLFIYPPTITSMQALKKVDYNTQTYFSLLHIIGSSRHSAVPNGSAVNLPAEKRNLPSKKAFKGIKVPTYDQVRFGEIDRACAHANARRA